MQPKNDVLWIFRIDGDHLEDKGVAQVKNQIVSHDLSAMLPMRRPIPVGELRYIGGQWEKKFSVYAYNTDPPNCLEDDRTPGVLDAIFDAAKAGKWNTNSLPSIREVGKIVICAVFVGIAALSYWQLQERTDEAIQHKQQVEIIRAQGNPTPTPTVISADDATQAKNERTE